MNLKLFTQVLLAFIFLGLALAADNTTTTQNTQQNTTTPTPSTQSQTASPSTTLASISTQAASSTLAPSTTLGSSTTPKASTTPNPTSKPPTPRPTPSPSPSSTPTTPPLDPSTFDLTNCTSDASCPPNSVCSSSTSHCLCALGFNATTPTTCSPVHCSDNAHCDAFGPHVVCNVTSHACTCHSSVWTLNHDTQRCTTEQILFLDIFIWALVSFLVLGALGVLYLFLKAFFPNRSDYIELKETESQPLIE